MSHRLVFPIITYGVFVVRSGHSSLQRIHRFYTVGSLVWMVMMRRTIQLATLAEDVDPILVGLRTLPVHKLFLMYTEKNWKIAQELIHDLSRALRVEAEEVAVSQKDVFNEVLEALSSMLREEGGKFDDFLVNASSGDRPLDYATMVAAFTNGLKAFTVVDNEPFMMPLFKFSYCRLISETKLEILKAISSFGGEVDSLAKLNDLTGFGKPLLSYHILGAEDSQGLIRLGLVDVERGPHGTTIIRDTVMGRMVARGVLDLKLVAPTEVFEVKARLTQQRPLREQRYAVQTPPVSVNNFLGR